MNPISIEEYILRAFQKFNILGLGEGGHYLENSHRMIKKILMNPQLMNLIDIIILEFANTNHQDTLDAYIYP